MTTPAAPVPDDPPSRLDVRPEPSTVPTSIASPEDAPAEGMVPASVRWLAWFLDDAIPLTKRYRVGADGFLSFIPGFGDAAGFGLSAVVVLAGLQAGVSWPTLLRMTVNAVLESTVGLVPLLGPAFSFVWKANNRNLRLIERDLANREAVRRESWKVLVGMLVAFVVMVLLVVAGLAFFAWLVLDRLFGN